MIETRLNDDHQSSKYINKNEISTFQIKYGYGMNKTIVFKMKNGETFETFHNDDIEKELSE